MAAKRTTAKPRARKPKAPPEVTFVARFHENERAEHMCTCAFPDTCDGERLIHCLAVASCECKACSLDPAEHVTGCDGCENCRAAVCAACGKRDPSVPAVEGESWTCSPECTRKMFTVAS